MLEGSGTRVERRGSEVAVAGIEEEGVAKLSSRGIEAGGIAELFLRDKGPPVLKDPALSDISLFSGASWYLFASFVVLPPPLSSSVSKREIGSPMFGDVRCGWPSSKTMSRETNTRRDVTSCTL